MARTGAYILFIVCMTGCSALRLHYAECTSSAADVCTPADASCVTQQSPPAAAETRWSRAPEELWAQPTESPPSTCAPQQWPQTCLPPAALEVGSTAGLAATHPLREQQNRHSTEDASTAGVHRDHRRLLAAAQPEPQAARLASAALPSADTVKVVAQSTVPKNLPPRPADGVWLRPVERAAPATTPRTGWAARRP